MTVTNEIIFQISSMQTEIFQLRLKNNKQDRIIGQLYEKIQFVEKNHNEIMMSINARLAKHGDFIEKFHPEFKTF